LPQPEKLAWATHRDRIGTGGSLAITNVATDAASIVSTFDTFAIRSSSGAGTAGRLDLTRLQIEGPKSSGR